MRFEKPLYSKRPSAAKRSKEAKKTLLKLAKTDPILKKLVNEQAVKIAYKLSKKAPAQPRATQFQQPPTYHHGMGADFYKTREWRELRYKVLVRYGKVCQCCGQKEGYIHVDHILPRSLHPDKELMENNLQVLCEACNIGKTNRDQTDWRQQ
jgi:5-methylcytosine-specific restriction endonuclease McrA